MNSQPIIVVAKQRSGTTVFRRTLDKTAVFEDFKEVFHPDLVRKEAKASFHLYKQQWIAKDISKSIVSAENQKELFEAYLEHLGGLSNCPFYLIDIKYNIWHHLNWFWQDSFSKPYLVDLVREKQVKVIHIIRKNVFKQTISLQRAMQTKLWQLSNQLNAKSERLYINPESCINMMNNSINNMEVFRKYFKHYDNYLELFYEDIYKNNKINTNTVLKLNQFLNHDFEIDTRLPLKKIINDLNQVVTNKAELLAYFKNTKFYDMVKSSF